MGTKSDRTVQDTSIDNPLEGQDMLEALISSSPLAMIFINPKKKIAKFNRQAETLLGYSEAELINQTVEELYVDKVAAHEIYRAVQDLGQIDRQDVVLLHKNGTKIPVSLSAKLIRSESGIILGQVGFMSDLRDMHLLEAGLNQLINTAKVINSTEELVGILDKVLRSTLLAIPAADRGSIHIYDQRSRRLNLRISSFDYSRKTWEALSFEVGKGIAGWVFEHQESIIIGNVSVDARYQPVDYKEAKPPRSMLCVPITGASRKIGVLSLSNSTALDNFSPRDLDLLKGFADQTAVAIENAEQIDSMKKEADEQNFLRSISLKINQTTKGEEILSAIMESGNKLLGTEMAVVHWRSGNRGKIKSFAAPAELLHLMTEPRLENGLTTEILRSGETVVIPNTAEDPRVNPLTLQTGIRSMLCLPLKVSGRVAGVLFFNSRQPRFFGVHEIYLISLLLPLASTAMENADRLERLERSRLLSESLMQVSSKLASTLALEEQMADLEKFLGEDLAAPIFYLGLYDAINETVHLKFYCDNYTSQELFSIPLKDRSDLTIINYVVQNKLPIVWLTDEDKRAACQRLGISPLQIGTACQTCLVFPLGEEGSILGVISIQSPEPNAWDEIEVSTFETLAHQASIAIRTSYLMQQVNNSFEFLKSTYESSEKIISEMNPIQALDALVSSACAQVGGFRACAVLINDEGIPYHISTSGFDQKLEFSSAIRREGKSLYGFLSGEPQFFENLRIAPEGVHPKMIEQNVRAAACLPLIYKDARLGVLWIHYKEPHYFSPREREALHLFTNQAAIAYENAKLHQQVNKVRDTAIMVAQRTVLGDLRGTLELIVDGVKEALTCDIVTLWIYRESKDQFDPRPATAGMLRFPGELTKTTTVDRSATPYKIIGMDDIYVRENTLTDKILGSAFALRENVHSTVAMPLKTNNVRAGVLFINYCDERHIFTNEELSIVRLFAHQAALAISNSMLFDEEQKRREVLKIIYEAGRTVTGSLKLDEVIDNLAYQAYSLLRERSETASFVAINLVKENRTILQAVYPQSQKSNVIQANIKEVDLAKGLDGRIGIVGQVVKNKTSILVKNVEGHPDYLCANSDTKCELAVPIIYSDEVVGVINVEHQEIAGLDEEDKQNIESLAAYGAVAIQNARNYQALQRKSWQQESIYEASKIITKSLELTENELLGLLAVQMVTRLLPLAGGNIVLGAIYIYDRARQEIELVSAYPQEALGCHWRGEIRSLINPLGGIIGISGKAVLEKKPQREGDVNQLDYYLKYNERTQSELDVPIMQNGIVLGVLSLECDRLNGFDKDVEDALTAFAELAVIAIQNARRYQELKDAKATVGNITAVAWMGLVAGAWRHAVGNMAITIGDIAQLAQFDLKSGEPTEKINGRFDKIQEIVEEIKKIPMPPLSSETGLESIHICQLVRDRVNQFKKKDRYKSIDFEIESHIDELSEVRANPEWIRRILDILIDNATNAMRGRPLKKINTIMAAYNGGVEILMSDTGTGIPNDLNVKLFKAPMTKAKDEKGSGLGLFLANSIIRVYGGWLEVRSTGLEGTTMALWLPLEP